MATRGDRLAEVETAATSASSAAQAVVASHTGTCDAVACMCARDVITTVDHDVDARAIGRQPQLSAGTGCRRPRRGPQSAVHRRARQGTRTTRSLVLVAAHRANDSASSLRALATTASAVHRARVGEQGPQQRAEARAIARDTAAAGEAKANHLIGVQLHELIEWLAAINAQVDECAVDRELHEARVRRLRRRTAVIYRRRRVCALAAKPGKRLARIFLEARRVLPQRHRALDVIAKRVCARDVAIVHVRENAPCREGVPLEPFAQSRERR